LFKYYDKKLSSIEKKRKERNAVRNKLINKKIELKHICNTNHKILKRLNIEKPIEETFEFEII
jgi:hypothetical protein